MRDTRSPLERRLEYMETWHPSERKAIQALREEMARKKDGKKDGQQEAIPASAYQHYGRPR